MRVNSAGTAFGSATARLKDDKEVLAVLEDAGIDRERVLGI